METFIFTNSDLHFKINCDEESEFDCKLRKKWNSKMEAGNIFWYRLNIPAQRMIDTKFLLQLNSDRANLRRLPANIQKINQAFDSNGFNFNKVKDDEKLFSIIHANKVSRDNYKNIIIVNVSPLGNCHTLLIPEPHSCLPQVLTEESLYLAVQLCLLSSSSYFRIVFNSLGGYASVNHLHFHSYYLECVMYLEFCPVDNIAGICFVIREYPARGFVFQIRNEEEIYFTVKKIFNFAKFLQNENIPYNVFITRGRSFESAKSGQDITNLRNCLRIYLWARKPSWGVKELTAFNIASCELFGHFVIKNENDYKSLTREDIIEALNDITNEPYEKILPHIASLF